MVQRIMLVLWLWFSYGTTYVSASIRVFIWYNTLGLCFGYSFTAKQHGRLVNWFWFHVVQQDLSVRVHCDDFSYKHALFVASIFTLYAGIRCRHFLATTYG
jgi:hypothetical protein